MDSGITGGKRARVRRMARWSNEPVERLLGEAVYDVGIGVPTRRSDEDCTVHVLVLGHITKGFLYVYPDQRMWATSPVYGESWYSDEISLEDTDNA